MIVLIQVFFFFFKQTANDIPLNDRTSPSQIEIKIQVKSGNAYFLFYLILFTAQRLLRL